MNKNKRKKKIWSLFDSTKKTPRNKLNKLARK